MSLPAEAVAALEAFQAVGSWEQRARMLPSGLWDNHLHLII